MKRNSIEVSIIVPILNVRRYIDQCLLSLISQTLNNLEIICVDGGSTDGTLEIIHDYQCKDSRIVLIESQVKSYGYQMNLGIQVAKGEYIGIVEPDDFIDKKMFQRMLDKTKTFGRADFVKGGYYEFADSFGECTMSVIVNVNVNVPEEMTEKMIELNKHNYCRLSEINHIWSAIYKKSFIVDNNIRFNETPGASFQDTSFSILVGLLAETCIYTRENFYYYRIDNPMSSVKSESKITCVVDEFRYVDEELTKRGKLSVENNILVQKKKLIVYRWNCMRLARKGREEFLAIVQKELNHYSVDFVKNELNQEESVSYRTLTSTYELDCYEQEQTEIRKHLEELCEIMLEGRPCVLVGCGSYGERVLSIQRILNVNSIKAVCDNSKQKQNTNFFQYVVWSIDKSVERFSEHTYIIANKLHYNEIKEDIIKKGVNEKNVFVVANLLSLGDLIQICCDVSEKVMLR